MPEFLLLLLSFSLGFAVVFFAVPKVIKVANKKQLFDVPNHRGANQEKVIPNLGGIAIFSGIFIATIISMHGFDANKLAELLLAALIMFLMGLKDDTIGLSPRKKLTGQIFVALYLVIVCNIRFTNLHGLFGLFEINFSLSLIISLISIIGLINAFNLIDGIDGLASGVGAIISTAYGMLFLYFGQHEYAIMSFSVIGSLVAFFFYNVFGKSNKIFMGDTGSLTLGVIFAVFTIWINEIIPTSHINNIVYASPAITLSIMIVPIIDTIRVFYIRISQKRSPFSPDMNHIHHHLIKITKNHLHATIIISLANIFFICFAIGLLRVMGNAQLFLVIFLLGFLIAYITVLINKNKKEENVFTTSDKQNDLNLHLIKPVKKQSFSNENDEYEKNEQNGISSFDKIQPN